MPYEFAGLQRAVNIALDVKAILLEHVFIRGFPVVGFRNELHETPEEPVDDRSVGISGEVYEGAGNLSSKIDIDILEYLFRSLSRKIERIEVEETDCGPLAVRNHTRFARTS